MKIKHFLIYFLTAIVGITACDEVNENERFLPGPPIDIIDTTEVDTTDIDSIIISPKKVVLVEEFTGQKCTNCPDAQRLLKGIMEQETYQGRIVVVGIHAGNFGIADGGTGSSATMPGLMQPEGNVYAEHWKVNAYPAALFNRKDAPVSTTATWQSRINEQLMQKAKMNIEVEAKLDADNNINISAKMAASEDIQAKLQLWITESHIVTLQIDNGNVDTKYEHNHVYRACVNGTWGEDVLIKTQEWLTLSRQIAAKENWNKNNLSVVAFVYDEKEGVYQVAECKVVSGSETAE